MTTRRWLLTIVAVAAVVLLAGRAVAGTYVDYLWYESLGASALWRARMSAGALLAVGSAAIGSLFAYANLYAVRHSVVSLVFPRRVGNLEVPEEVPGRYLIFAAASLSVVLGILLALPQDAWPTAVLANSGTLFGETVSYVGADLGFFVYWLPFENMLWNWAFLIVAVVGASVVLLYALTPSLRWQSGTLHATTYVRRHVTVLVGAFLLLLAWAFRLNMYELLSAGGGADGAFSYADDRVGIPGSLMLSLATLAAALLVIWAGLAGQLRLAGFAVLGVVFAALIVRQVVPAVVRRSGSNAERVARELSYQGARASFTGRAFAVDAIRRADSTVAYPSLGASAPWVPVWDPPAISRIADVRNTVDHTTGLGWHASATGIVADVIEPPATPGPRAPWSALHLLASSADERGAPVRVTYNGTPTPEDSPLELPLVFPDASAFAIVADSLSHVAGTPLESIWARLAYAWSLQNFRLLFSDLQQPHPTIIARRDVRDRVGRLTPFFTQGRSIEPILVGDSLYWTLDLYSTSATYPLSRHYFMGGEELSYLHHAATAIVQASTGEVSIVPDSLPDPIADTWFKRLPTIFSSWSALPAPMRALQPPAIDAALAQAVAFGRFGTRTDRGVPRHMPVSDGSDSALASPRPLGMILPGDQPRAVTIPLVDDADHLHGVLISIGGPSRATFWYPLTPVGPRWNWVLDRLRSLDSAGSAAREGPLAHGPVRVVPVRPFGVAFIQPTYRWRTQMMPTLNRIAALAGDSLQSLAPSGMPSPVAVFPPPTGDLRSGANALYAQMRDALRRGDWVAFGRAFDALGRALADSGRRRR
jgi:uncharacterized membrane protein (UPF0182 family)